MDVHFFAALALWLIFNGRVTTELVLVGIVLSFGVSLFHRKCLRDPGAKRLTARQVLLLAGYAVVLVWEIVKSSLTVIRIATAPKIEIEPQIVFFHTDLKEERFRVILANSITLTPGTITVLLENNVLCVHCLDKSMAEGLEDSVFVRRLRRIEQCGRGAKE